MLHRANNPNHPGKKALLLAFALGFALAGIWPAGEGLAGPTISDFTFREFNDLGKVAWLIFGKTGLTQGNKVKLQGVRMVYYGKEGEIQVFSPECELDEQNRMGRSTMPVHMRGRNMTIDGVGFDLDIGARRMTIRRNVKVRIFDPDVDLLGKGAR